MRIDVKSLVRVELMLEFATRTDSALWTDINIGPGSIAKRHVIFKKLFIV
jgi:hypothetical protein